VDDDWICREVAGELLKGHGVLVTPAETGRDALGLLGRGGFDLVLTDVNMPEMDGVEVARRIKADPALRGTPIVAMTAESFDDTRERFAEIAVDAYLAKPVEPDALTEVLSRFLPASQAPRA
jgi:CheY-like chemotaxis protein